MLRDQLLRPRPTCTLRKAINTTTVSIQPLPPVRFEINETQYITCDILGQIGGLLHVVGISSMASPRKQKNRYKKNYERLLNMPEELSLLL